MPPTKIIYVGTENGLNVFAFIGQQWRPAPPALVGKNVAGIAIAADNPATLYATVKGYGLYKTEDNGISWRQVLSANAHSLLMDTANPNRLWVGVEPAGIQRSLDGGETWQDLSEALLQLPTALDWSFPDPPYQARLRTLAQPFGQVGRLLAGIEVGGLICSGDGGESWILCAEAVDEEVHVVAVHPLDPHFWLVTTGDGVHRSEDGGQTWDDASAGMAYASAGPVVILPSGICLTAASGTPPGNWVENLTSDLYRSTDRARNWQQVDLGQTEHITALAAGASRPNRVYVGTQSGAIYSSHDQGQTWEQIAQLTAGVNTIVAMMQ